MLVLSRKPNEKIILRHIVTGETIVIEQCAITPTQSRLGITAGQEWRILRAELEDHTSAPSLRPVPPIGMVTDPDDPYFGEDFA